MFVPQKVGHDKVKLLGKELLEGRAELRSPSLTNKYFN